MSENLPINPQTGSPSEKPAEDKVWNHGDFWLALLGSFIINGIFYKLIIDQNQFFINVSWLSWVLNIGVLIASFILKRPRIYYGIFVSYAIGFILVLCNGISTCFTNLSRL